MKKYATLLLCLVVLFGSDAHGQRTRKKKALVKAVIDEPAGSTYLRSVPTGTAGKYTGYLLDLPG